MTTDKKEDRSSRFVGDGSEIVVPSDPRWQEVSDRISREEAERKEIGRRFLEERARKKKAEKAGKQSKE